MGNSLLGNCCASYLFIDFLNIYIYILYIYMYIFLICMYTYIPSKCSWENDFGGTCLVPWNVDALKRGFHEHSMTDGARLY